MKTDRRTPIACTLILCLFFLVTPMVAQRPLPPVTNSSSGVEMTPPPQPPPPPPPPSIDSNPKHPAGRNDMLPPLPDLPDLTPDQQSQMKKATLEHIKSMTPLKNQLHEKTVRLRSIMTTEPWDARNADQVAEEIGKAETQMLKETIRFDRAIRSLLSPDQQVLFDARPKPFLNRGKSHTISGPGNLQGSRP